MKKLLALTVAFAMTFSLVLAFLPVPQALADDTPGVVIRRALIIGNTHYAQSPLEAPAYDARHMRELFKQMNFTGTSGSAAEQGPMLDANIADKYDRTAGQILKDIDAAFAGADEDDVSYFYYSGHGTVSTGEAQLVGVDLNYVSLTELKQALDKIKGTKVVLLDSCFSGGFINKSNAALPAVTLLTGGAPAFKHNNPKRPASAGAAFHKPQKKSTDWNAVFPASLKQLPPKKDKPLNEQFNGSVTGIFSKTSKYIDSGKYIVLTAAADSQYSYEFPFALMYGPLFTMNDFDYADANLAYSGEFTGMLVAGAGIVTFHRDFGETSLLADFNADKKITAEELHYFLTGAVTTSDVKMYPDESDPSPDVPADTVIFSHDTGLVQANPTRVSLADGIGSVTTDMESTAVRIDVVPRAGISNKLVIYRYPKSTDGGGSNGYVEQLAVRTYENVPAGITTWDGKDADGQDVPDGTYRITLEIGADLVQPGQPPKVYPGLAVVMARGISDHGTELTLAGDAPWTGNGIATIAADGPEAGFWFTAPADGAMNVTADLSGLTLEQVATCTLADSEGNAVNFNYSTLRRPLYLPFAVQQGRSYYLKFGLYDDIESEGMSAGSFPFSLKLNGVVGVNEDVAAAGSEYEAWLIKPSAAVAGDYYILSSGGADTAATLVDANQIERIAANDDFVDKQFFLRTPLIAGHGYLLVIKDYNSALAVPYSFKVSDPTPEHRPVFSTSGISEIPHPDEDQPEMKAATTGASTYWTVTTGNYAETWTFTSGQDGMGGPEIDDVNDPYMMLIDQDYNVIGQNDDYNVTLDGMDYFEEPPDDGDFDFGGFDCNSAFSVVLPTPHTKYILVCRNSALGPYDFAVTPASRELDPLTLGYTTAAPKAVFGDNGGAAIDRFGNVTTWGINLYGDLGQGTEEPSPTPQAIILPFDRAYDIWASDTMTFVRLGYYQYCYWGAVVYGDAEEPVGGLAPQMLDCLSGMDVADIQCGAGTLALVRTYTGDLFMMDLAYGEIEPVALPGVEPHMVRQIAATDFSFFALTYDGDLYAWGDNWTGECGTGNLKLVAVPVKVNFGGGPIAQIAAGWDHVLALTTAGEVYAWGNNRNNELGQGAGYTKTYSAVPLKVSGGATAGLTIAAVYAGGNHSMCVDEAGNAYAWGVNAYGELSLGHAAKVPAPEKIAFYNDPANTLYGDVDVQSMSAGMFAVFAQDFTHNVYGYGSNLDYQLANAGMPPKEGVTRLMTLLGEPVTGHSTVLSAVHTDTGYAYVYDIDVSNHRILVWVDEGVEQCYIMPEPADPTATFTIDGHAGVRGLVFDAPDPGGMRKDIPVVVTQGADSTTYMMDIVRAMSTNAKLRSLSITSGAALYPAFSKNVNRYTVTLPETMSRVSITPTVDGFGAHYRIDTLGADRGKLYTLAVNQTVYSSIRVTAQNIDFQQTYNLTIRRPYMLSALSARPVASGYPSLSPGGTNRMRINYTLTFPAAVKIEVKKGSTWYTVLSRTETKAGALYWDWDGKVRGAYLATGTYTIRVTPTYKGAACTAKMLTVKILRKPTVSIPSLSPTTFRATGSSRIVFSVKWSVVSDVKVEIVNSAGRVVYTVWNAASQLPATKTLYWYGKTPSGSLVPAGAYRVRVTCGGASPVYRSFTVKR